MAQRKPQIGAYVRESLVPGEALHAVGSVHPVMFVRPAFLLVAAVVAAFYAIHLTAWVPAWGMICGGVVTLAALPMLKVWVYVQTAEAAVTSHRVITKTGWLSRKTDEISILKVEAVLVDQGIFERMLNVGDVIVKGTGGNVLRIYAIKDPMHFRTVLQQVAMAGH